MTHPSSKHDAHRCMFLTVTLLALSGTYLRAEEAAEEKSYDLAMQLVNPVAALISLPLQNNFDWGGGPDGDGFQYRINIQPVIPFSLNEHWNLISRTILPCVDHEDVIDTTSQSGLSDALQSLFFSPKAPTAGGWISGAGPVLLLPTATDDLLGTERWGAGPTAVFLRQDNGWAYGMLANHIWPFAGESTRQDVDATFLQPFLTYTTDTRTTLILNVECSCDWENSQWTVPINVGVAQLFKNRRFSDAISTWRPLLRRDSRQWPGVGSSFHRHIPLAALKKTPASLHIPK